MMFTHTHTISSRDFWARKYVTVADPSRQILMGAGGHKIAKVGSNHTNGVALCKLDAD